MVAKESRPHGNPPKGTVPRSISIPTHTAAAQTGQPGSRLTATVPNPHRP
jgi:hypothetical protein